MPISFFKEDVEFPTFFNKEKTEFWLEELASLHKANIQELNYIFCSDEYLLQINRKHLNHDYYTDIITFPYGSNVELSGDIFVSLDRVLENAASFGVHEISEFLRVMAHGVLHLIGFNDKNEKEEKQMRMEEEKAISLWKNNS